MEYRNLGNSGLKVSTLCLGAMTFGDADEKSFMHEACADGATSRAIMNKALDAGLNFIDTADVYGQDGLSERVIGKWFEAEGKRDQVIFGARTDEQVDENLKAAELVLPGQAMAALDEASAAPLSDPYDFISRIQRRW